MKYISTLAVMVLAFSVNCGGGEDGANVGSSKELKEALADAGSGDVIKLDSGRY